MGRFSKRSLIVGGGIPNELKSRMEMLLASNEDGSWLSKVVIISKLNFLFAIDGDWSRQWLLPMLRGQDGPNYHVAWIGFLWGGSVSMDLLGEIGTDIIVKLSSDDRSGKQDKSLYTMFAIACLEAPDLFTNSAKRDALKNIGADGRKEVAWYFYQQIDIKEESTSLWLSYYRDFFTKVWPLDAEYISEETSEVLVLICLRTGEAFKDAVEVIVPIVHQISSAFRVFMELEKLQFSDSMVFDVLALFYRVFSSDDIHERDNWESLWNRLREAESEVGEDPRYVEISNWIIANSHQPL